MKSRLSRFYARTTIVVVHRRLKEICTPDVVDQNDALRLRLAIRALT